MRAGWCQYRRKHIAELRPFVPGEDLDRVSISAPDVEAGSPKLGDMIARNPKNHDDQWLVAAAYFADNFEPDTVHAEPEPHIGRKGEPHTFVSGDRDCRGYDDHCSICGLYEGTMVHATPRAAPDNGRVDLT